MYLSFAYTADTASSASSAHSLLMIDTSSLKNHGGAWWRQSRARTSRKKAWT